MTDTAGSTTDAAWNKTDASATQTAILKAIATGGSGGHGNKVTTTPTIASTSTLLLAANPARISAILTNPKTEGQTLFVGVSGVTTSVYAVSLEPGDTFIDGDSKDAWYAVVVGGTLVPAVTEVAP
jgi:hypothetical protein